MLRRIGIGCAGLIGLVLVISIISAIAGGNKTASTPSPTAASQAAQPTSVTPAQQTPTTAAIAAAGLTPTTVAPSPTQVQMGTKENPVPRGVYYLVDDHGAQFQIRVVDVVKNASAQVKKANSFNETPPTGNDYVLVNLEARYFKGDDSRPYHTTNGDNRFFAQSRLWGAPVISIPPEPAFEGNDIFPGADLTGWLPGKYLPAAAANGAALQFMGVYFGLDTPSAAVTDQKLEPLPTADPAKSASAPVGSRLNPVPLGTSATITDNGQKLQVTVKDVALDANAKVKAANMFNPDPPTGYGYVMVSLSLTYSQASGTDPYKTSGDIRLYAANRLWGAPATAIGPDPQVDGQDIFQGAKVDGWLPPRYLPTTLEKSAALFYGGTYFALHK